MGADTTVVVAVFALWAMALLGWILNVVKFAGALSQPLTALEVLRGFGIIAAPLGAVLGWF